MKIVCKYTIHKVQMEGQLQLEREKNDDDHLKRGDTDIHEGRNPYTFSTVSPEEYSMGNLKKNLSNFIPTHSLRRVKKIVGVEFSKWYIG